jgi:putative drug exporter of the RND superfamily
MNKAREQAGRNAPLPEAYRRIPTVLERLADLAYNRPGRVVLAWVALLVAVFVFAPRIAGEFADDESTPGSESKAAAARLAERFKGTSGDTFDVVWQAPGGVSARAVEARMDRFLERTGRLEGVGEADEPEVSRDGTIAVARLQLDRSASDVPSSTTSRLKQMAETASVGGLRVELGGFEEEGTPPELYALVAAAIILVLAFGSIVAAGLPLLTALFGLGISAPLIGVVAAVVDTPDWAVPVAALLGIGVGIDYALLILTRFRSELSESLEPRTAVVEAVRTAGRSVLVAGTTVVISILGLFLVGIPSLRGVALSASLAVLLVMAATVTLLPALLAFLGPKVNRLPLPGLGRAVRQGADGGPAARWSRTVQRRSWAAAIVGTAILLVLAAPALGVRLGFPDEGNNPARSTTRQAYDLVSEGFGPGANGPLFLAVDLDGREAAAELGGLAERLRVVPGVAEVSEPRLNEAADAALLLVTPTSSPQDGATNDLVRRLRDAVLPQATTNTGMSVYVGGQTAAVIDASELVSDRLPLFIAGVLGLSLLFILAVFRSPALALKAGTFNLLSVGAAYGVLAFFAQGGWAGALIGIDTETPVPAEIPVIMFAILFGLSMDYEVFLLSRVREEYLRNRETDRAVVMGVAKTARVITAAAAIMVVVFLAFIFSTEVFLKLMGVGMAAAILVDATVVRMMLVPAVIQLLGHATWWIPRWLDRLLPRLDVEPGPTQPLMKASSSTSTLSDGST